MRTILLLGLVTTLLAQGKCGGSKPQEQQGKVAVENIAVSNSMITKNSLNTDIMQDEFRLTKKFERFDSARFDQRSNRDRTSSLEEYLLDGSYVELSEAEIGKQYELIPPGSYFSLLKLYYPNGNIREKGFTYVHYFPSGVWYEFNEYGDLIREVDYDAPFTFTFDGVLKFCGENNIPVVKGYVPRGGVGFTTGIRREVDGDKCWWIIEYLNQTRGDRIEVVYLDGKTGVVIKQESMKYINE